MNNNQKKSDNDFDSAYEEFSIPSNDDHIYYHDDEYFSKNNYDFSGDDNIKEILDDGKDDGKFFKWTDK